MAPKKKAVAKKPTGKTAATSVSAVVKPKSPAASGAKKKVVVVAPNDSNSKKAKTRATPKEAVSKKPAAKREGVVIPAKAAKKAKAEKSIGGEVAQPSSKTYKAVELRFLPEAFQEMELTKFLNQFGAKVINCVCLRHKKTNSSRGIALIRFDNEDVIPTVIEECDGMMLGDRTVRARHVFLTRPLPPPKAVVKRQLLDKRRRTRGASLKRFVNSKVQPKDERKRDVTAVVGAIMKHAKHEKETMANLKKMGINYNFTGFRDQLSRLPRGIKKTKAQMQEQRLGAAAAATEAKKKAPRKGAPKKVKKAVKA